MDFLLLTDDMMGGLCSEMRARVLNNVGIKRT